MNMMTSLTQEHRRASRTGIFLRATLRQHGQSCDITLRNLSENGALVEGKDLPEKGRVTIERGDVGAQADIVWTDAVRRGIRFADPINLARWLPHLPAKTFTDAVAVERLCTPVSIENSSSRTKDVPIVSRVGEELALCERTLRQALDTFAETALIAARHPEALQKLERLQQRLSSLSTIIAADDRVVAIDNLGDADMKRRLLR